MIKNLRERIRKIDFIFVFLLFLIPVINFAKRSEYPLVIVFLVIAALVSKARYNWVYFSQKYRDGVKKRMFEKTPFSEKLNSGFLYVQQVILIIIAATIFFFYCLYSGKFDLAIGAFVFDLLFVALLYTFIKF